jgi:hypothetical protein
LFFPVPLFLPQVGALVVLQLAARQREIELDAALLVMQVERDQGIAALLDLADQAADLLGVHQELACAGRVGDVVRRHGR